MSLRKLLQWPMSFFWFWGAGNLMIYSWAGEHMPWLTLHTALPLCLITGAMLPPLFEAPGRKVLKGIMALGCLQVVFNSLRVNGPLSEGPWEPLMYAHSGPDIKASLLLIEEHLEENPGTRVWADDNYAWPLAWYFRETPVEYPPEIAPPIPGDISVILVPPSQRDEFVELGWIPRLQVDMTTWPRPHYHQIHWKNLNALFRLPSVRKKFLRYYFFRDQPEWGENEWPGPNRYLMMTR